MVVPRFCRSATAGVVGLLAATVALISPVSAATACNNSPSLCSRNYNNVTYMGAHGSSFLRDGSEAIVSAGNQFKNATVALDAGLRFLQAQVHKSNDTLHLCHTSCELLDAGTLEDWLSKISYWMSQNPNDVVTLLLVNSDEVDATDFGPMFNNSGIAKYAYKPNSTEAPTGDWPTLENMIASNTRLVSFLTNTKATPEYPYLLPEFDYVFETAFEVVSLDGFNCTVDRPSKLNSAATAVSSNYLSLVNHFKYQTIGSGTSFFIPDVTNINIVNSANTTEDGNLGKHLKECNTEWNAKPNFVLVDLFDEGNVMVAADRINGISDVTGRATVSSEGDDDGSSAANGRDKNMGVVALIAFVTAVITLV